MIKLKDISVCPTCKKRLSKYLAKNSDGDWEQKGQCHNLKCKDWGVCYAKESK